MAKPTKELPTPERLLDLGGGLAIYRAHLDRFREADMNARVMDTAKFEQLVSNVKRDQRLESLPYVLLTRRGESEELRIISGHHRLRAARAAGLVEVFAIVDESELSSDAVTSKQLAHNAINGYDDEQVLKALYDSIGEIEERIASGLTELESEYDFTPISVDDVAVSWDFEVVGIVFTRRNFERYQEVVARLDKGTKQVDHAGDLSDFERFRDACRGLSDAYDVRSVQSIFEVMLGIVEDHLAVKAEAEGLVSNA